MPLSHIIAHRIQRTTPTEAATLKLRDKVLSFDGKIEECFRELKHCMIKRLGKEYGQFSSDTSSHPLSSWLLEYTADKMSFESVSQKAMQHLKNELDKTEEVIDCFVFFAHESQEASECIHIFFVQHNAGQFIDGDIELSDSLYLNTSDIRLGAKIDLTEWQSDDHYRVANTLSLLRWRGEKELSDIFIAFIGLAEKIDIQADTEEFLNVVSDYTKDLPEDIAHHTKKQVVNYCIEQDKSGKPVVMAELSQELKSNPAPRTVKVSTDADTGETVELAPEPIKPLPEFERFVESHAPSTKPELRPDHSQLRQYVRLSGRNNQLSMSFASSCLGDSIVYDPETDSLIIKEIPTRLKAHLTKHLQNS